uniref:Fatty acid hydroxylase domain-containing protein n=1 Tax=Zooxanthella nutricula TaxID=1333877 RepID=A0A7S2QE69_9DINO|mmetsp:Transcript_87254/g.267050  ORF Transcript_87254/g.267050 Transcript_87254/m.267050 type:complete len:287 (+) Transcript_87254:1-861(+)
MKAAALPLASALLDPFDALFLVLTVLVLVPLMCRWHTGAPLAPLAEGGVRERVVENFVVWLAFYGAVYAAMYAPTPLRRWVFAPFKTNPEYPSARAVSEEILWSAGSVAVATLWQIAVDASAERCGAIDEVPLGAWHALPAAAIVLWADSHFYWQHRLMHSPPLYQRFHKIHHRSKNPNPWSGLLFHPVEAAVYFSPSVVCLVAPWLVIPLLRRALHFGLLLFPLRGHMGHGWPNRPDPSHYVHHVKFNFNFGAGGDYWDEACGTFYGPSYANCTQRAPSKELRSG